MDRNRTPVRTPAGGVGSPGAGGGRMPSGCRYFFGFGALLLAAATG